MNQKSIINIELNDNDVALIGDKSYHFCKVNGKKYPIEVETNGKKEKFWINIGNDKFLLKYDSDNDQTLENAGQFIMCGVLDQINFPCAKYYAVNFTHNGIHKEAIMTKNFLKEDEVEMSGFKLNSLYNRVKGVNEENHELNHSIYGYSKITSALMEQQKSEAIEQDLFKVCLLQYVFNMTDLHYYNLGFVYNGAKGINSLKVSPFYDCGNVCGLQCLSKAVENDYYNMQKTRKLNTYITFKTTSSKMPMFGINENICKFDESSLGKKICRPINEDLESEEKLAKNEEILNNMRNNLAIEMVKDPEFFEFYKKLKEINFDKIKDDYANLSENCIPSAALNVVRITAENNMNQLNKCIDNAFRIDKKYDGCFSKQGRKNIQQSEDNCELTF